MAWLRLYVVAEGDTERQFADSCLVPHLHARAIATKVTVITTNRKLGKRGGVLSYRQVRDDICRRLKEDGGAEARFSTMLDFYALPQDFPGREEARRQPRAKSRIEVLEAAFANDIADPRFIPYLQLHEFEALLYADLSQVSRRITGSSQGIATLQKEVLALAPEEINEGSSTAPSKRLIRCVPAYQRSKIRVGAPAAAAIGLPRLRAECPHFAEWIRTLENLNPPQVPN